LASASEVERVIADLTALRRKLQVMTESYSGGTVAICRFVDALGTTQAGRA
jgi:hypothetical protein